jgi:beta-lactamase class A
MVLGKRRWPWWLSPPLILAVGLGAGFLLSVLFGPAIRRDYPVRENSGRLTNPLLDFEIAGLSELQELRPFHDELADLVAKLKAEGAADEVAVYFRDLNNGLWMGLDESEKFVPGSLYKVPLIIACLSQAERDPAFLGRSVRFTGMPSRLEQVHFGPSTTLQAGKEYTVLDLIQRTARRSDNGATFLLNGLVDRRVLRKVFTTLGIDADKVLSDEAAFSPVDYGRFFRILFNASYLNREMSELALTEFAQSEFRLGLVAGLPQGTLVAHKFGEYLEGSGDQERLYLHDCGIVYFPGRPYLLCVMTRGRDSEKLAHAIAQVSGFAFRQVKEQTWMHPAD